MSAPLRHLLTVHSQAAELLAYLKGVEQTLSRTLLLERFGHKFGEESAETVPVGSETDDGLTKRAHRGRCYAFPCACVSSTSDSTCSPHETTSGCGDCLCGKVMHLVCAQWGVSRNG